MFQTYKTTRRHSTTWDCSYFMSTKLKCSVPILQYVLNVSTLRQHLGGQNIWQNAVKQHNTSVSIFTRITEKNNLRVVQWTRMIRVVHSVNHITLSAFLYKMKGWSWPLLSMQPIWPQCDAGLHTGPTAHSHSELGTTTSHRFMLESCTTTDSVKCKNSDRFLISVHWTPRILQFHKTDKEKQFHFFDHTTKTGFSPLQFHKFRPSDWNTPI
jgi:hypothetical protein